PGPDGLEGGAASDPGAAPPLVNHEWFQTLAPESWLAPTPPGVNPIDFSGTLTVVTRQGTVTMQATGMVDVKAGTFTDAGTIIGGTRKFKGVAGNITSRGSFNGQTQSLNGSFTGSLFGRGAHKHQGKHPWGRALCGPLSLAWLPRTPCEVSPLMRVRP